MKNLRQLAFLVMIVMIVFGCLATVEAKTKPNACSQGTPFRGCVACGTTNEPKHRALNVLKNRSAAVTSPKAITVQEIRDPANNKKFMPTNKVSVTGFVASVDPGGLKETCNCKRTDLRDVHINLVADPSEASDKTKYVVVEFTPRWEKKFTFDDSNYEAMRQAVRDQIGGKWVQFDGWMMYDFIHEKEAKSTAPGTVVCNDNDPNQKRPCVWRGTPWEVHPVTAYKVVPKP